MSSQDVGASVPVDPGLFQAAVEAMGEAVVITSAELDEPGPRTLSANPAFTRTTGYEAHEVLGQTPRLLQGLATQNRELDKVRAALTSGEPAHGETVNYRKDGSTYVVEWLIAPVRAQNGHIMHQRTGLPRAGDPGKAPGPRRICAGRWRWPMG